MAIEENLHNGHRTRMIKKLLNNIDSLAEHELLEVLLYPLIPRKDTNGIAHKLLRTFGNLSAVLSASALELQSVDGIGEKVASELLVIGKVVSTVSKSKENHKIICWSNYETNRQRFINYFKDEKSEKAIVLLLNSKFQEILSLPFNFGNAFSTEADVSEIANSFALHKPKFVIISHNHPSGNPNPSKTDDYTTIKIKMICDMYGVAFADHIIVAGEKTFSYYRTDRIKAINNAANIDDLLNNLKYYGV